MKELPVLKFLLNYSFEDLAKSFFVLNLWLPNVSSQIKSQLLYIVLESIFDRLPEENVIIDYKSFNKFSEELISLLPAFPMLEDFMPEGDSGEIKYYLNKKFYKIFYGGDLSNTYDFYYSFEVLHEGFKDFYSNKIRRSPVDELEFCVKLQSLIIDSINVNIQDKKEVKIGNFEIPSESFWQICLEFLNSFNPISLFNSDLVDEYTKDLTAASSTPMISEEEFISFAYKGKNCFYFFLKKGDKYFPVLPRSFFSVLFDKWGKILRDNYSLIEKEVEHHEINIGVQLYHFLRTRAKENDLIFLCSALNVDLSPHKITFTTAFRSKSKLILIHILPLQPQESDLQNVINDLIPDLVEAQQLLSKGPTKLGLHAERQIIEFRSLNNSALEPFILTVVPHITTDFGAFYQLRGMPGQVIGLDQLLGILDELNNLDELSDFFDYMEQNQDSLELVSHLDVFGSFRDSNSVLVAGANIPNFIMLDPHWGTQYRYESLSRFWKLFPKVNFFGHPRSWAIKDENASKGTLILDSKKFFGYVYCYSLERVSLFINSPVDSLRYEQAEVSDFMMRSLVDGIDIYKEKIQRLSFKTLVEKLQILFLPLSLVQGNEKFSYVSHLISPGKLWAIDITRIGIQDYGMRVVFDDAIILEVLKDAKDRSVQIDLLLDVLKQINTIFKDQGFSDVESELILEKSEKNRFRFFTINKGVSFPELAGFVLPKLKEYKLADKKVAEIAKENNVLEGEYEGNEAKIRVDSLKNGLVTFLNSEVELFNLEQAIPILLENIDALTHDYEMKTAQVENSLDQEVDYERDVSAGEHKQKFLHHHKNYKYLIEKFVQIQPKGMKELSNLELSKSLALVDRLLSLYAASDLLHYGIYPAKVNITDDFLAEIDYGVNINLMQDQWAKEQAQISLGMLGKKDDRVSSSLNIASFIEEIDESSQKDLGFRWTDMINLQHVLALWPAYSNDLKEETYYKGTIEEIREACIKGVDEFDASKTEIIVEFLTLDPQKILLIEGDNRIPPDLPIWEYRKRVSRYSLRCIIKIGEYYFWGAHSIDRSGKVWGASASSYKLPADIKAPTIEATLKKGHDAIETSLQNKIKEIVFRFTPYVETEVFPHRIIGLPDIGDIDVFAFIKEKNILLNIESKIIDIAFCTKDLKRISEKIFGRRKSDNSFQEGYLQMVEKRSKILSEKGVEIAGKYWGKLQDNPQIISLFVTQMSYWWTKYPPVINDVNFVEIEILEQFLENLLSK